MFVASVSEFFLFKKLIYLMGDEFSEKKTLLSDSGSPSPKSILRDPNSPFMSQDNNSPDFQKKTISFSTDVIIHSYIEEPKPWYHLSKTTKRRITIILTVCSVIVVSGTVGYFLAIRWWHLIRSKRKKKILTFLVFFNKQRFFFFLFNWSLIVYLYK